MLSIGKKLLTEGSSDVGSSSLRVYMIFRRFNALSYCQLQMSVYQSTFTTHVYSKPLSLDTHCFSKVLPFYKFDPSNFHNDTF